MNFITQKLDEIDIEEEKSNIFKNLQRSNLGRLPEEVAYHNWLSSIQDFEDFVKERKSIHQQYDRYCESVVPLLEIAENSEPKDVLRLLSEHYINLFLLDYKRRMLGSMYNKPGTIGWKYEQEFSDLVEQRVQDDRKCAFIVRETIVNILAPELPFDVQKTLDMLVVAQKLDLKSSEFNFTNISRRLVKNESQFADVLSLYARGSINTFTRKLLKYRDLNGQRETYMLKMQKNKNDSVQKYHTAIEMLLIHTPYQDRSLLDRLLDILKQIAVFNALEDIQRRECMDRFEEFLLRQFVCKAFYELGMISSPNFYEHDQRLLVHTIQKSKEI